MKMNDLKIKARSYSRYFMVFLMTLMLWSCESANNEAAVNEEAMANLEADSHGGMEMEITQEVDVLPEPEEGLQAFLNYIGSNIRYPEEAKKQGIEGKVFIRFVVTREGSITKVEVEKGIGYGLDDEAVRVISSYDKKWKPGVSKGKAVNTKMILPVSYAL